MTYDVLTGETTRNQTIGHQAIILFFIPINLVPTCVLNDPAAVTRYNSTEINDCLCRYNFRYHGNRQNIRYNQCLLGKL